mmetsp:Transcript_27893/g.20899  ORF Transcript_27893/g.20899 Transcript_27893/m.20899 type:complete len:156 (-) Transcript_27893:21-488(-)
MGSMLDSGEADFAILDLLDELSRRKFGKFAIYTSYARGEFIYLPVVEAMLENNILFKSKYYDLLHLEHQMYEDVVVEFVKRKKQQMNAYERLRYRLYRKVKGVKMGNHYTGVYRKAKKMQRDGFHLKEAREWDLADLYFDIPDTAGDYAARAFRT